MDPPDGQKVHAARPKLALSQKIWGCSIVTSVLFSGIIGYFAEHPLGLALICGLAALFTTSLTTAPYARFFEQGWRTRRDGFLNELYGDGLIQYLRHFWNPRATVAGALPERGKATDAQMATAKQLFAAIYEEQYGIGAFVVPLGFLLLVVFLDTHYVMLVALGETHPSADSLLAYIERVTSGNALFAVSSICGAFLFVVGDSVDSVRKQCLNASDVYWYALRMMLAVPIAWALTSLLPSSIAAKVAFAMGALPVNFIMKQLRQLAVTQLKAQPDEVADQLIKLDGVTSPTVALLTAEGITSIDQLLGVDPVLLSIHTGLPFRTVLRLCSQAIVRRYFGDAAFGLSAVGLSDAPAVYRLVAALNVTQDRSGPEWEMLTDVSALLQNSSEHTWPDVEVVRFAFESIATFSYTHFLMAAGFENSPLTQASTMALLGGTKSQVDSQVRSGTLASTKTPQQLPSDAGIGLATDESAAGVAASTRAEPEPEMRSTSGEQSTNTTVATSQTVTESPDLDVQEPKLDDERR